jgi:hypothetical protein
MSASNSSAVTVAKRPESLPGELRLTKAISDFGASLDEKHRVVFRNLQGLSAPTAHDVIRITEEINSDGSRIYKAWNPHGTRMLKFLDRLHLFTRAGDILIGGSQNLIASGIWAVVRVSLQVSSL